MNASDICQNHAVFRHEIGNNLALLSSHLQLLASKYPQIKEDDIFTQMQEDLNVIYTILNYEKTGSQLHLLPCDPGTLLEDIFRSCRPILESKGIELQLDVPPSLPIIRADSPSIRQALLNLIKNAAEAVKKGQTICLHAESTGTHLLIKVSDNGIGITEEQQLHILEPFTSYKTGGTGLGLPFVKSTVYAHHGQLTFHSVPGKGSSFQIALPLPASPV